MVGFIIFRSGSKIQKKTMSSLLQFHNSNVAKVVNSFGGVIHQFNSEHFLPGIFEDMEQFDHFLQGQQ